LDSDSKARTIAVLNHKGGAGKTALAVELAAYLALAGERVLVIDLDPQVNLTKRIGYTIGVSEEEQELPKATLFDMLDDPDANPMADCLVDLWSIPGLSIVPGDPDIHELMDLLPAKPDGALRVRDALEDFLDSPAGRDFDFVFIDCPPSKGIFPTSAMIAVDEIMAPVDLRTTDSLTGIFQLIRSFDELPARYQPADGIFLVGNLFDEVGTDEAENRDALGNLGLPVASTVVKTRKAISKSQNRMSPLVEQVGEQSKGARKAYKNISALAEEIRSGKIKGQKPVKEAVHG